MEECSKSKLFCVYVHTSPSGKRYVGLTSKLPSYRWDNGNGYKHNKYFWSAIQKYGWDNFDHQVIASELSEKEAQDLEIALTKQFNSTDRRYGYNIILGGGGGLGNIPSDETRRKLSNALKGRTSTFAGHRHTESTKRHLSEVFTGRHHSDSTIQMMRDNSYNKLKVGQFDKTGRLIATFSSMCEAERATGIPNSNISKCCNGLLKSAGGYVWKRID